MDVVKDEGVRPEVGSSRAPHVALSSQAAINPRSRSSFRLAFESEKAVLRKDLGELEQIRIRLGLSRRRMSQILMVDPSAWTRWTKSDEGAPPHVYRMLEWYLLLKEKHPTLAHQYYERLSKPVTPEGEALLRQEMIFQLKSSQSRLSSQISAEVGQLQTELSELKRRASTERSEGPSSPWNRPYVWGVLGFVLGLATWTLSAVLLRGAS